MPGVRRMRNIIPDFFHKSGDGSIGRRVCVILVSGMAVFLQLTSVLAVEDIDSQLAEYTEYLRQHPDDPLGNYNSGCLYYQKGDYEQALSSFQKSLLTDDVGLEADALYNIANTEYRSGRSKEQTDLPKAVELIKESLEYYKRSIDKNSKNKDARQNHEFVERELKQLLDRLQKQQQQKQQQKQEQKQCPDPQQSNEEQQDAGQATGDKDQQNRSEEQQNRQQRTENEDELSQSEEQRDQKRDTDQRNEENSGDGQPPRASSQGSADKQSSGNDSQQQQGLPQEMSREEAETLLEHFAMQEKEKLLEEKERKASGRQSVYLDW